MKWIKTVKEKKTQLKKLDIISCPPVISKMGTNNKKTQ